MSPPLLPVRALESGRDVAALFLVPVVALDGGAVAGVAVAAAFAGVGGAHLVGGGGLVGWLLGSVCGGVGLG